MPLIMVGQNLQSRHAELRAQSDYEINLKAEREVEIILLHLERQAAQIERQGELMLEVLSRMASPHDTGKAAKGGAGGKPLSWETALSDRPDSPHQPSPSRRGSRRAAPEPAQGHRAPRLDGETDGGNTEEET